MVIGLLVKPTIVGSAAAMGFAAVGRVVYLRVAATGVVKGRFIRRYAAIQRFGGGVGTAVANARIVVVVVLDVVPASAVCSLGRLAVGAGVGLGSRAASPPVLGSDTPTLAA